MDHTVIQTLILWVNRGSEMLLDKEKSTIKIEHQKVGTMKKRKTTIIFKITDYKSFCSSFIELGTYQQISCTYPNRNFEVYRYSF